MIQRQGRPDNVHPEAGRTEATRKHRHNPIAVWIEGKRAYFPFLPQKPGLDKMSRPVRRRLQRIAARGQLLRNPRTGELRWTHA